ncbi:polysaccharide biosynthesis protein [Photobacterium sanguinicancri]|uniref:polysaccharide biosynthesis protein n=1 Tax=Photobacterium sanguinicancri TaxID=875932 RepID=UPI0021C3361A|nr:nucleoside-diphosphate sugar epimerase/dehydratase [Photobacterium sanguinicancri]
MSTIDKLWELPRKQKFLTSIASDIVLIFIAFWSSFGVRLGNFDAIASVELWLCLALIIPCTLIIYNQLGVYRTIVRYLSYRVLLLILVGSFLSGLLLAGFSFFSNIFIPRTVPVIFSSFLVIFVISVRLLVRGIYISAGRNSKTNVVIYGAGSAGRQLSIALKHSAEYRAVAFIDRDRSFIKTTVLGLPVLLPGRIEAVISRRNVKKVLLAVPRASSSERKEILEQLSPFLVEVLTVPTFVDIVSGKAKISELQDVHIEDLLGRDPVIPQENLLKANIFGKVVMVTGAGGSIGSELCRQIIRQSPRKLILFELSEFALYQIEKELSDYVAEENLNVEVLPLLGSVQRQHRLEAVMNAFEVQTVYHAAAYKHVPMVEFNVVEGVRNNVFGTYFTAKAAIAAGVESFVLISTDKAVRPTNVMGTTKRLAELTLQALAAEAHSTRFCMVRFGNVLGSSGSVIPLFKKQIASGGPITVTHPDIIRYFMTIPEAAQLVIQAGAMGNAGDVFVLDMGEPVKIVDLATNLVKLSGLEVRSVDNPDGDIEIQYSGLRPGEKLFEELLIGDNVSRTKHERIMMACEVCLSYSEMKVILDQLDLACHQFDHEEIRNLLLKTPTGFNPTDDIGDLVWIARHK